MEPAKKRSDRNRRDRTIGPKSNFASSNAKKNAIETDVLECADGKPYI